MCIYIFFLFFLFFWVLVEVPNKYRIIYFGFDFSMKNQAFDIGNQQSGIIEAKIISLNYPNISL